MPVPCDRRSSGQVPTAPQVPAAAHNLGRRGDDLLLQGTISPGAQGLLSTQLLPNARREAISGQEDRTDAGAGQQLVQEPPAARPRSAGQQTVSSPRCIVLVSRPGTLHYDTA